MPCRQCKSTWRARAVLISLLTSLGYSENRFLRIESDFSRVGLGISDDINIVKYLSSHFMYSNSFYDAFPFLDLRSVPSIAQEKFEFVICSDVLEHVDKDLEKAIAGVYQLIKQGGFAIITVPIGREDKTFEYYPGLSRFKILESEVHWENKSGIQFVDQNPDFHGGRGQNLAFRQFSREQICNLLSKSGFEKIHDLSFNRRYGVPALERPGIFIAWKNS
jgi:SAM-dependent methyltransferase